MLTTEQKACNDETWHHINRVQHYINIFVKELISRVEAGESLLIALDLQRLMVEP